MEPTPLPPDAVYDPLSCISTGSTDCSFTTSTAITPLTQLDRDAAKSSDVWSVDADRLACPRLPVCVPVVNGIIVRRDHTHLTATYVLALTDSLEALLRHDHIL